MDASASTKTDHNDVVGLYLKIEKSVCPSKVKQRNTVSKYTKLPEFDIDPFAPWSRESYSMQPRLRRIIALEEPLDITSRSLKHDVLMPPKTMYSNVSKRKIVTITEDDEYDLHPRFSKDRKSNPVKTSNRSSEANFKEKQFSQRTTSRVISTLNYARETRPSAKLQNASDSNPVIPKTSYGNKKPKITVEKFKSRNTKEKESNRSRKSVNPPKTSVSKKNLSSESEKEIKANNAKLNENVKTHPKRCVEKYQRSKSPILQKNKPSIKDFKEYNPPLTVIHVPLDGKYLKPELKASQCNVSIKDDEQKIDRATDTEKVLLKDMNVSTEPQPVKVDQVTDMHSHSMENQIYYKCTKSTDVQTEVVKEAFDSLHIPDVTLTTDKTVAKVEYLDLHSKSLPNLRTPPFKITPNKRDRNTFDTNYCNNTSYIISRATLTYTTKQKINFKVVGSDNTYSNHTASPLAYPMNVVSVFKNQMKNDLDESETKGHKRKDNSGIHRAATDDTNSLDPSYVSNSNKLMKPSDIISTIRVNNGLTQSDYICEQFQRELNFIESFLESLEYLESCSLSETCLNEGLVNVDSLVKHSSLFEADRLHLDLHISDYDNLITKLEDGDIATDSETMASKNLFLLNILIRDEQRRAKNLLFVLKRREDALKDFAKSQILYLENKKKNYSQDFSVLQKKQRGALLKLQHECGEMQRMRKALLTLSERRKVALMRTKKDLELKLKNNVDVERIILSKKKLKRNAGVDRTAPLKCFDLSSSGCEESSASGRSGPVSDEPRSSAEKSIQTGETIVAPPENSVAVDGSYLNILFQNLSLPQIFSGGKQYEVNEEALKNIVNSTTGRQRETVEADRSIESPPSSSSASTARSLLDELELYYRGMNEDRLCEVTDDAVQAEPTAVVDAGPGPGPAPGPAPGPLPVPAGADRVAPVHSATIVTSSTTSPTFIETSSVSGASLCGGDPSMSSLSAPMTVSAPVTVTVTAPVTMTVTATAPAHLEAEELRRQQLAIEREIKELEQAQYGGMVVVREIPDKPPPPYTPPLEPRAAAVTATATVTATLTAPRRYRLAADTRATVARLVATPRPPAPLTDTAHTDAFDVFIEDFCSEAVSRHAAESSSAPWAACNMQPACGDRDTLAAQTTAELEDVLAPAKPTVLSGVSCRRSDHIDDILFAEWRRVETSWTSLHADEAHVKSQLFETIFQRLLSDTVDEYRRTRTRTTTDEHTDHHLPGT